MKNQKQNTAKKTSTWLNNNTDIFGQLKLSKPAQRALVNAGITSLESLARHTRSEIAELHGMGPNALGKLEQAFSEKGLSWKNKIN
jgi:hypothetical protein